ncbi:MAG TPA: type II secretion system protein [Candidatus Rifleibacterium sp.]|jgi:type II secretory pathway pseudopilin PulG|nr:type II secretion system protein [Candidatus Rifleibacterium sp.]
MNSRKGITLMELLVAIPMLAIIALSISYTLGSSSRLTATQIARVKCQIAASNLLTLIKAASGTASLDTFAVHVDGGELKKTSVAHPDGSIRLTADAAILPNTDSAHGTMPNVFRIRVYAPAFDMRSEIKTYFGY